MVDYSQLMSGVLVASTAFLALTLVQLGQMRVSAKAEKEWRRYSKPLLWSFITGILAILIAMLWFVGQSPWCALFGAIVLVLQINLFWPMAYHFWSRAELD